MSALDDEKSYTRWINNKAVKLRRPTLDCGCTRRDGEATAGHIWCNRLACLDHADDPHDCSAFGGVEVAKGGTEEESEPAEAAPPVSVVQSATSSWVSFADVAAGPSSGGTAPVDVRRRVQDGTAPTSAARDLVGPVFRAEVLRQGLTECEVNGVRWIYGAGHWSESPYQPEPVAPPVDAAPDPDPAPTRNPISDLYAALRARARRGGTQ